MQKLLQCKSCCVYCDVDLLEQFAGTGAILSCYVLQSRQDLQQ